MPSGLILTERKSLPTLHSEREWATSQTANERRGLINPRIRILPISIANGLLGGRVGVKLMAASFPQDVKFYLNADEPQVDQRPEDVEAKREYPHSFSRKDLGRWFFLKCARSSGILYQEKRGQVSTTLQRNTYQLVIMYQLEITKF